jgi:hypothetical protein
VSFLREAGSVLDTLFEVPALSRTSILANSLAQLDTSSFGARLHLPREIFAERTMLWRDGAHTAKATVAPSSQWLLAEGNAGAFETFVLLVNPHAFPVTADVSFLTDAGDVVRKSYAIDPQQRLTILTNLLPELASRSFATTVQATAPIVVERTMYFRNGNPAWQGGHASSAVPAASTRWFLAEGRTGRWFETFILIGNPNQIAVTATLQYMTPVGIARTEKRVLAPTSRTTIVVNQLPGLEDTDVACAITASAPIVVERSMYWPGTPGSWHSAHNSSGLTELSTKWVLAEGEVGGPQAAATFVLLANPGGRAATVDLTVLRAPGLAMKTLTRTVGPGARVTVSSDDFGLASGERFGIVVTATEPIAVERSIYWSREGQLWSSGTNETGMKVP